MNTSIVSKVVLTVLVLIALGLGIAIYNKNQKVNNTNSVVTKSSTTTTTPTPTNTIPVVSGDDKLTADERALFYSPQKDATSEQLIAFSSLVAKNAVEGDTVMINDCKATPIVLKMKYGNTLTVKNTGTTDIHFGFGDERTLVKAGTNAKIKTNYKNGSGVYGYGCDDITLTRSIGLLLLTQ